MSESQHQPTSGPSTSSDPGPKARIAAVKRAFEHGIVPLRLGKQSKKPTDLGWQRADPPSLPTAESWASSGNVGFRTGAVSGGLVVVDIDPGADPQFIDQLPVTVTVLTGSTDEATGMPGMHLYFRCSEDLGNKTGSLPDHVDLRGTGGYVVAPGSIHPDTGVMYRWAEGKALGEVPIADLPAGILALIKTPKKAAVPSAGTGTSWVDQVPLDMRRKAGKRVVDSSPPAIEGQGGDRQTFRVACDLVVRCGLGESDALELLEHYATRCSPPWSRSDLKHKVDEALKTRGTSPPSEVGRLLADFGSEILAALGIVRRRDGDDLVVQRGNQTTVVPEARPKDQPRVYGKIITGLAPELPKDVISAAAKTWAEEPVPLAAPEEVFSVADRMLAQTPADILAEAKEILNDPSILDHAVEAVSRLGFDPQDQEYAVKAIVLGQLARLTGECFHVLIQGQSGEGKSDLARQIGALQPAELREEVTSFSEMGLAYVGERGLVHKVVILGERRRNDGDGDGSSTAILRQFVSDNCYTRRTVGDVNGTKMAVNLRIDGPASFVETTTSTNLFSEDESRMIKVVLRSSPDQRRRNLGFIYETACGIRGGSVVAERTKAIWNTVFRHLRPRDVMLPKGPLPPELESLVDVSRSDARRTLRKVLALVKSHALLHQHQRAVDGQGRLLATEADIQAVVGLWQALHPADVVLAPGARR